MVEAFGSKAIDWMFDGRCRCYTIKQHLPGCRIALSKRAIRDYLDSMLNLLVHSRVGTDTELVLGSYTVSSSQGENHVVVKRSNKRLPRSFGKYAGWVTWDVRLRDKYSGPHNIKELVMDYTGTILEQRLFTYNLYHNENSTSDRLAFVNASVFSQVLLQCLFNPLGKLDLLSKPLPVEDLHCRIGEYRLVYDHLDQEWRLWMQ